MDAVLRCGALDGDPMDVAPVGIVVALTERARLGGADAEQAVPGNPEENPA